MGDVARCAIGEAGTYYNEDLLYRMFGVNAELLIDHAWGYEPCTIADIKVYKPSSNSICSGQVLSCAYTAEKAKLVVREMTDAMVLDLVEKGLVTDQIVLTVGYDIDNLKDKNIRSAYTGELSTDRYGRKIPKHAHGTGNIGYYTSSTKDILRMVSELYDRIINPKLLVRRITVSACRLIDEKEAEKNKPYEQIDMFTMLKEDDTREKEERVKEKKLQTAMIDIKKKFGKNAILKGMNFEDGATAKDRNGKIGGHKA
jgi:DNA polymerase V